MSDVRARPLSASRRGLVLVLLLALVLVGGCARVRTALAVQPDDTVTGEMVLATPDTGPAPQVTLPEALAGDVDVTPYRQEGYAGSVLTFTGLTFDQVGLLPAVAGSAGEKVRFSMRRAGGRVLVTGNVDLTAVSVDKADFQLKISFPGQVVDTDGDAEGGTVSWTFVAGEVGDVSAVVGYDDPNAPSVLNWTIGLAAVVALLAVAVVVFARRHRNPPPGSPGAPAVQAAGAPGELRPPAG